MLPGLKAMSACRSCIVRDSDFTKKSKSLVGGKCGGGPPDPIPNSEVKPSSVDGTAWETVWESRSLPTIFLKEPVHLNR